MKRKCSCCGNELELSSFYKAKKQPLGYGYICKACTYERTRISKPQITNLDEEEWRIVDEFPNYAVSNKGRVKRIYTQTGHETEKLMSYSKATRKNPYRKVLLCKYSRYIHRLVAIAFIPNPYGLPCVNHKDGNKCNNSVENLEWVSRSENVLHAYRVLGITPSCKGKFGKNSNRYTPIIAYSVDGDFKKEYNTITEASKELCIDTGSISRCAKGLYHQTHGYIFRYI